MGLEPSQADQHKGNHQRQTTPKTNSDEAAFHKEGCGLGATSRDWNKKAIFTIQIKL